MDKLWAWFDANRDGLMIGLVVALVIVAVMLVLREFGRRSLARDPLGDIERPKRRKRLSSAEVGLLEFLAKGKRRRRKAAA